MRKWGIPEGYGVPRYRWRLGNGNGGGPRDLHRRGDLITEIQIIGNIWSIRRGLRGGLVGIYKLLEVHPS